MSLSMLGKTREITLAQDATTGVVTIAAQAEVSAISGMITGLFSAFTDKRVVGTGNTLAEAGKVWGGAVLGAWLETGNVKLLPGRG